MSRLSKAVIAVMLLNLLATDVVAWRVDRAFRSYRDIVCSEVLVSVPGSDKTGIFSRGISLSDTTQFSTLTLQSYPNLTVSFYGCDGNGHKYRMWIHRF